MPSSGDIDAALRTLLQADATLSALLPDGVFRNEARAGAKRFVIVSLVDEHDDAIFGGRAIEDGLYLVKGVALSTTITIANVTAAEARIDVLLEDQLLNVPGYTHMTMHREERVNLSESDEDNPDIRWFHFGGFYRVQQSLTTSLSSPSWIQSGWIQ